MSPQVEKLAELRRELEVIYRKQYTALTFKEWTETNCGEHENKVNEYLELESLINRR